MKQVIISGYCKSYMLGDLHANAASTKNDPADTEPRHIPFRYLVS
jgi:hypothetical protein